MKKLSVMETAAEVSKIRPVLKPLLETFGPVLTKRNQIAEKLAMDMASADIQIAMPLKDKPSLQEHLPAGLGAYIKKAALEMLPVLCDLEPLTEYKEKLQVFFLAKDNEKRLEKILEAMLSEAPETLTNLAKNYDLEGQILAFTSEFIVSAVLYALTFRLKDEEFLDWHKSVCPICGSKPTIAWLGRRPRAQNNEFLVNGGGKKHLHCGRCGVDWHFMRGVCPGCGINGQDAMQIIGEEGRRHERIDWCKQCGSYLPQIDLREMGYTPDMDAMALGMSHLDFAAAEKELIPLKLSFWNMF